MLHNMNEKQIAEMLVKKLKALDFVVHRNNAVTTNSIYLKLDFRCLLWY